MATEDRINLKNSLLGFVQAHKDLIYVKNHNILLRNDDEFKNDKKSVLIISGGGSGHEPFPGGFVGKGMLSAAICGEIFTSPSVSSCLASILLTSQNNPNREILMVINNYTGDRLNFGLAIEMAKNIHKYQNIKTIVINDDCSIENARNSTGKRGLSGINLVIKIAGAMSSRGFSITDIYEQCSSILDNQMIQTIGFTFQHSINSELNQIDIGYGIHGEPGALKIANASSFKSIIDILVNKLKLIDIKSDIVVLFNNLGGASDYIFSHFIHDFMDAINKFPFNVVKTFAGTFLTSLGKEGIGISIMEIRTNLIIELLDYPIETAAKHLFNSPLDYSHNTREIDFIMPKIDVGQQESCCVPENQMAMIKMILLKICRDIIDARLDLNHMDQELGDGDTGETLSRGANALLAELSENNLNIENPHKFLITISDVLMSSMGGTAGAIFSIFHHCASTAFNNKSNNEYSIHNWLQALWNGIDGIMRYGRAETGDRTLLDSLYVGYNEMKMSFNDGNTLEAAVKAFANGCRVGAENTKTMLPKSGRSSYTMADKGDNFKFVSQYPDSGAYAISIIANAIFHVLQGRN